MQNLKTGIVVALLLAVCYGAFKALNAPEPDLPPELAEWVGEEPDFDSLVDDIQLPDSSNTPKMDPELEGLPSISLPPLDEAPLKTTEPELNAQTHGTPVIGTEQTTLGERADNQAHSAPLSQTESVESLVPENFSSVPLEKPVTVSEQNNSTPLPNAPENVTSDFPSIPLPGKSLVSTKTSEVTALPLLNEKQASTSPTAQSSDQVVLQPFAAARELALKQANEGNLKEALVALTQYYHSPEISHTDFEDLLEILDALAREVIFSQRSLLRPAFTVGASDTLDGIAAHHNVTPELLRSVNQLGQTGALTQGQQLKVIDGPFRGEVDLTRGELTIFLKDMYACRFPIAVGTDYDSKVGTFEVSDKRTDRTYYGIGGKVINAADPSNPYGGFWIDLGGNCIHGSPEMAATDLKNAGCISLAPIDASDAFKMLTLGCQVEFRK